MDKQPHDIINIIIGNNKNVYNILSRLSKELRRKCKIHEVAIKKNNLKKWQNNYPLCSIEFYGYSPVYYHGKYLIRSKITNKIVLSVQYVDNKKHGELLRYFDNGKIKLIATYQNDILHGRYMLFWGGGHWRRIVAYYHNGKLHGDYYDYNKNGVIKSKKIFNNGVLL